MALTDAERREYEVLKAIEEGRLSEEEGNELLALYQSDDSDLADADSLGMRTVQEMPSQISMKDRLIAKNFAQSPEKQIEFLKKQYPDMVFDADPRSGQIRARNPQDTEWRVLDPDTGMISGDILGDIGDIGFDVYAGASEGLAALKGAVAGGALGGGVGAIPGAMAAGGAMTAGNEAIRQKLGQYLGIPQEVDKGDVAMAGGIGAVAPGLFGAGPVRGVVPIAASYGRRALGRGAAALGSKVSGVPKEALLNYSDRGVRDQVTRLEQDGVSDFVGQAYDQFSGALDTRKNQAAEELLSAIDGAGRQADIAPAKQSFTRGIVQKPAEIMTPSDQSRNDALRAAHDKFFGLSSPIESKLDWNTLQKTKGQAYLPDQIPARDAFQIQKDLKQMAKWEQGMTPADVHTKSAARDASMDLNRALDQATDGLTTDAKKKYKTAIELEEQFLPKMEGNTRLDTIQKSYSTLSGLDGKSRKAFAEKLSSLDEKEFLDLVDRAKVLNTYSWLGDAKLLPVSSGGTTSTTRSIPLSLAGGYVGAGVGVQAGPTGDPTVDRGVGGLIGLGLGASLGSPAAMKRYIRAMQAAGRAGELVTPRIDPALQRAIKSGAMTEFANEE